MQSRYPVKRRYLLKRGLWLALAAVMCSAAGIPACDAGSPVGSIASKGSTPNIVVIMIDTLRPDYLDLHGYPRETAPFLKRMSEKSTVFDNAFSTSSWTSPATASALTSLYPTEHGLQIGFAYQGVVQQDLLAQKAEHAGLDETRLRNEIQTELNEEPILFQTLSEDLTVLPEILKEHGYTTFALSANINISEDLNFDQGFDHFSLSTLMPAGDIYTNIASTVDFMNERAPYFLYLQYMDPHEPYHPRLPYFIKRDTEQENMKEAYLSEIRYLDEYLGKLFEALNMDENTLLVFITDHGEEFNDHGGYRHGPTLYGELNDALMMYYGPSMGIEAQRHDSNVSLIDVMPTVLDLAGIDHPQDEMKGESLAPIVRSEPEQDALEDRLSERVLFAHRVRPDGSKLTEIWAAIHGDRKLIVDESPDHPDHLFDLENDPAEVNDLIDDEPETVDRLRAHLDEFRATDRVDADIGMDALDEDLEETLESLGYLE